MKLLLWILGVLFLLVGITNLTGANPFTGLLVFLAGFLTIPDTFQSINQKFKNKLTSSTRALIIIILIFFGASLSSGEESNTNVSTGPENKGALEEPFIVNNGVDDKKNDGNEIVHVVSITDGDTIRVDMGGKEFPVRLIGIDTPEINHPSEPVQCYGLEAKEALSNLILDKDVVLEKDVSDVDSYNRNLRYVWLGEVLVNEYMTENGYALSSSYPPDTKYQERILAGEVSARASYIGFWSAETCNGDVYTGTYRDPNEKSSSNTTDYYQQVIYTEPVSPQAPIQKSTSSYSCNCSKTCPQMSSCEEAYYQLNICGCRARDGDNDGIPCESICR